MKTKYLKLYDLLVKAKEIQIDIVANDGKKMTEYEREQIVKVWNLLDETMTNVYGLLNKPLEARH